MSKDITQIIVDYTENNQSLQRNGQELVIPDLPSVNNPLTVPSIKHNSDDDIFAVILMALATSYTDLSWKQPSNKDKEYMANKLADSIPSKFPSIRLHEIPEAFANGIRGKYGEFMGLGVVSFENFIEAHLSSEKREQFAKEVLMIPERIEPDINTKFITAKNNALKAYQDKKYGKDISLVALVVYTFLNRLKLIQYSAKKKWEFVDKAKEILITGLKHKLKLTLSKQDRNIIKRDIENIQEGFAVDLILNMSKRVALLQYFDDIVLSGTNLDELIDSKQYLFNETEPNINKNENHEQQESEQK
ncbi:hypothetical protein [Pedobacter sp. B4-66]|uniref:hypothetical protein n=1 Tax=Pedobacter sp. B4-66 TaxID=2817280 RepID=UPI001BDB0E37|nr:hypothetical protein [Pedobacter sp. B4-66]